MVARSKNNFHLTLPPELRRFVEARVSAGEYDSADAVILAGLRLLKQSKRSRREAALASLRKMIAVGLDQARRGELLDGDAVFDELERRSRKRRVRRT
jgi:antitoxin ParD1/3/4